MMKKVANSLSRRHGDAGKVVKYTPCSRQDLHVNEEDLEEIAVVSNADPGAVKYGSGPCITANGPRVVHGIITSERGRHLPSEHLTASGTRLNMSSPVFLGKSNENVKGKSVSKQSLLEMVSTKFNVGGAGGGSGSGNAFKKRFSKDSVAYINRAHVSSDQDVRGKGPRTAISGAGSTGSAGQLVGKDARKRDFRSKLEKWETSTSGSERSGCKWTFVFDPSGRLCYYWSMVVSVVFLYNFWALIYRFSFQEINGKSLTVWFSLDYMADFLYICDVAFHFRTGYLEDGVLQTDSIKLRQHYMNSTTFYIDLLCLLPLDFLYLSIGYNSILRSFRLVKIYRFWAFLDRTERHTNYPNVFRALSLIHYLMVIFHWNACLFHIISVNGGFGSRTWVYSVEDSREDVLREYLHAFYWSTLTLTTIGELPRPRTKGEYLFVIIQLIFGLLLFATVLGHVANIVTNVSAARKEFQAKLDGVKTYMRMRRVSQHLQVKVIKWFDYLWMTQKSSDEEKAVSCLPDKLKAEIAIHVHLDTLKRVEIFQNTEAGFLCELVLRLRPVLFSPGDYICRKGEVGKEMYIVNRGRLQVVADNGKTVLATLRAGSYFGEISILNMGTAGNRRTASVRSVGYSDLFCLSKQDMWDVLKEYPAARVRLEAIASKRLDKYRKAPLEKRIFGFGIHCLKSAGSTRTGVALGRSHSTPGLVESSGQVPLEAMYVPPRQQTSPSEYSSDKRNLESPLTVDSTNSNVSEDGGASYALPCNATGLHSLVTLQGLVSASTPQGRSSITTGSVASYGTDSTDKLHASHPQRSSSSALEGSGHPTRAISPFSHHPTGHPTGLTPSEHLFFAQHPQPHHLLPSGLAPPPYHLTTGSSNASVQSRHSPSLASVADGNQQELLAEIKRLRERLATLETENASMSMKLSQQQWEVEHRLAEIEMHICGGSSVGSVGSGDENERNRESII